MENTVLMVKFAVFFGLEVLVVALVGGVGVVSLLRSLRNRASETQAPVSAVASES